MDAAIATALALGVVSPASSGIGGGGFALVYVAKERTVYAFDFREVGPKGISPSLFRDGNGAVVAQRSRSGGLAVAVPGEVAGLDRLSQKFGALPWSELVNPAQQLAQRGFQISWFVHQASKVVVERLDKSWYLAKILGRHGRGLFSAGDWVRRKSLAFTLGQIAAHRSAGLYAGPVAADIVDTVQNHGGVLSLADLTDYQVLEHQPLVGAWKGYRIYTMPLPSSGGIALLEAFGILESTGQDLAQLGHGSSAMTHLLIEVLKHVFADRARFLGDARPSSVARALLDPARLKRIAKRISPVRVAPHKSYGDKKLGKTTGVNQDGGTSHLCVLDKDGNAVALTTTINGFYGSGLLTPKTGIVLNNEIDDFSIAPGQPNMFGLVQSDFNLVAPGKRPLSSMTPTLVLDNDGVMACAGGSGGPRIISNTIQVLLNVLVFGLDAREAVSASRIHHQWVPDQVLVEKDMIVDVRKALRKRGHKLKPVGAGTAVQLITSSGGVRQAASDPRKGGAPAAQPAPHPRK